jgi:hypothetical protein
MKTFSIVKRIIDILYEAEQPDVSQSHIKLAKPTLLSSPASLEKEIKEKDKLIAELYKENIKLENRIRQYEQELEVFSSLNKSSHPLEESGQPLAARGGSQENEVVEPSIKPEQTEATKEEMKEKAEKISRKEYMREYGKNYRKKQKEKKIEMNL